MTALIYSVRRNCKVFFKDKAMFFSSLITPIILLVLYAFFLAKVFKGNFADGLEGAPVSDGVINGLVAGQLVSSLLAVCCVTVAFCSNLLMVQDKASGIRGDLTVTPVKRSTLALSYYLSTLFATLIVCLTAMALCLIYTACVGWYMSAGDVFLVLADVLLLSMFGTALSSIVNFFLSTQGQMSAVGTIVSAGYGFICGAYMPLSFFGKVLQNILAFLPGTYGTSLIRMHSMQGAFRELSKQGWSAESINAIADSVDCRPYVFGVRAEPWVCFLVLVLSIVALIGVYVLLNVLFKKKKK